jgi:hypothetical protein
LQDGQLCTEKLCLKKKKKHNKNKNKKPSQTNNRASPLLNFGLRHGERLLFPLYFSGFFTEADK